MEKYNTLTTSCRSVHVYIIRSYNIIASRGDGRGSEIKQDDIIIMGYKYARRMRGGRCMDCIVNSYLVRVHLATRGERMHGSHHILHMLAIHACMAIIIMT